MKKIMFISYEFPPVGGGTGKAVYYTAREFVNMGHEVLVFTLRFGTQLREEDVDGIKVFRVPALRKKKHQSNPFEIATFALSGIAHAGKIADKLNPDIVLAYFTIPSGLISLWLRVTRKIPFFTMLRGQDVPGWLPESLRGYHAVCKPLIKFVWKGSAKVIANSLGLAKMAKKTLPLLDVGYVPNGVDTKKYHPPVFQDQKKDVTIFFSGRLRDQKGLVYLLEAVDMLKKKGIDGFILKIAGSGPEEVSLREFVKARELDDKVEFLGYLEEPELVEEYRKSDIFVNPSLNEGMPNAVLEAMAAGLPCVVTDVEGNNELIENGVTGYIVEPRDPETLSDALEELITDSFLREKMGKGCREKSVNKFSWEMAVMELMGQMQ